MNKRNKTYEGPLVLDMPFGEALARFAQTNPKDLSFQVAVNLKKESDRTMTELTWNKELSTTDAQRPTSGGLVPYLRLTKSSLKAEDFHTWFRDEFFGDAKWSAGTFGRETDIEIAKVVIAVSVNGIKLGDKPFSVTHGPNRWEKHSTPNTWLHWPSDIQDILLDNDFTGCLTTLTRQADGRYRLDIHAAKA